MALLFRFGRSVLIGLLATPVAGVAGAVVLLIATWWMQEAVLFWAAPGFLFFGVVFGSWHAAPVVLGVLPVLAAAGLTGKTQRARGLWLGLAGVAGAFRMYAIEPETMAGDNAAGWVVILAGGMGGLAAGTIFWVARAWITEGRRGR
jgi:hypothetical protein